MNKTCARCGRTKSMTEFNRCKKAADGHQSYCKVCQREFQRSPENYEARRAVLARYRQTDSFKKAQKRYRRTEGGKASCAGVKKRYRATERGKRNHRAGATRHRERYPQKEKARKAVWYATQRGDLPPAPTLTCAICGDPATGYHHHNGYDDDHLLDVVALCTDCHIASE